MTTGRINQIAFLSKSQHTPQTNHTTIRRRNTLQQQARTVARLRCRVPWHKWCRRLWRVCLFLLFSTLTAGLSATPVSCFSSVCPLRVPPDRIRCALPPHTHSLRHASATWQVTAVNAVTPASRIRVPPSVTHLPSLTSPPPRTPGFTVLFYIPPVLAPRLPSRRTLPTGIYRIFRAVALPGRGCV